MAPRLPYCLSRKEQPGRQRKRGGGYGTDSEPEKRTQSGGGSGVLRGCASLDRLQQQRSDEPAAGSERAGWLGGAFRWAPDESIRAPDESLVRKSAPSH